MVTGLRHATCYLERLVGRRECKANSRPLLLAFNTADSVPTVLQYFALKTGVFMTRVITVEREYGSQGAEFAHHLAKSLGWKIVDSSLVREVAIKAGVDTSRAQEYDEHVDPWLHRVERAIWLNSVDRMANIKSPEAFDSTRMVEYIHDYLLEEASRGNCVIVGRGAACVLADREDAFHIFVYTSMPRKIRWFTEQFPERAKEAEREIVATDKRRAEYMHRFHHHDWFDRQIYHLMLNTSMGFDTMVTIARDGAGLGVGNAAA